MHRISLLACASAVGLLATAVEASSSTGTTEPAPRRTTTSEPSMLATDTPATSQGWTATPLFTVGESVGNYLPVGILDGIGAYPARRGGGVRVLVNHELNEGNGYAYTLRNGTLLNGARVSRFSITREVTPSGTTVAVGRTGLAYDTIYDRRGDVVVDPAQINEDGNNTDGFARFCSSKSVLAGTFGFVDNLYFTGEETGIAFHPHGGSLWVIDVDGNAIWGAPALGRGTWENVTPMDTGDDDTVALMLGDDTQGAPMYLFIGQKDALGDGSFLDRNGLAVGQMYVWTAGDGSLSPEDFNGFGASRMGQFVAIEVRDEDQANQPGYDSEGYLNSDTLQNAADALGGFSFSRPEDLSTNPVDGTQIVFASTGRGSVFPADNWGTVYILDVDFSDLSCLALILHDADDLPVPDSGIRSPDNLDWATDGKIYIQEDRSTSPGNLFGGTTGIEASIWRLDPVTGVYQRIAEVDRSIVVPAGTTDIGAGDIGNWETSGILDVTDLFETREGELLLIGNVQAHGIRDGVIGDNPLLDEGGQLFFLSKVGE